MLYQGSCHCGAIRFEFNSITIDSGLRCNCSLCKKKGAVMTSFALAPEDINVVVEEDALSVYQFDSGVAQHYFCNRCGIYPFHQTLSKPGHYRVNIGCLDSVDSLALKTDTFDGQAL